MKQNVPFGADGGCDDFNAVVHGLQTQLLVQGHAGHHVHRRRDQLDLHLAVRATLLLTLGCCGKCIR